MSPETLQAVPKLSCVMYNAIIRLAIALSEAIPIKGRKGSADMIEPPGAPGDAIIAMPKVRINGTTRPILCGIPYINKTAVAQQVMVIMEPGI